MEPRCSRCVDCPVLSSCGTVYVSNPIETNSKQISSTMWVCAVCSLFDRSPVPLLAAHPRCRFCHCHSNSQLRVSVDSMD